MTAVVGLAPQDFARCGAGRSRSPTSRSQFHWSTCRPLETCVSITVSLILAGFSRHFHFFWFAFFLFAFFLFFLGGWLCCARSCLRLSDRRFWYSWIDCFAWSNRLWLCSILRAPCSIDAIPLEVKHGNMDGSSTYAGKIFLVFEKEWCQTLHGKQKSRGSPWKSSYIMLHLCFIQGMVKRFSHLIKRIMQQRPVLNSKRRVLPLFCYHCATIALPLRYHCAAGCWTLQRRNTWWPHDRGCILQRTGTGTIILSRLADGMGGTSPWYMSGNVRIPSNAKIDYLDIFGLRIPTLYVLRLTLVLREDHGGQQKRQHETPRSLGAFQENTRRKWPHHVVFALSTKRRLGSTFDTFDTRTPTRCAFYTPTLPNLDFTLYTPRSAFKVLQSTLHTPHSFTALRCYLASFERPHRTAADSDARQRERERFCKFPLWRSP